VTVLTKGRIGAAADHRLQTGGVAADLDETRARFVDAVLAHDQARQLIRQAGGAGRRERLAGEIGELVSFSPCQHETVVANRLPRVNGADAGAGMDRRQHVKRADEGDIGVPGEQHTHGVGIAGDMDILDLEIAHPAFLLRHEIGQRKRRDRPGKYHLDLRRGGGGCVDDEKRRRDAKDRAYCAQPKRNLRHDISAEGQIQKRVSISSSLVCDSQSNINARDMTPVLCQTPPAIWKNEPFGLFMQ
jgi:hypothetical protein